MASFSTENPLFACYAFHASVLLLKTMFMGVLTGKHRIKHMVMPTPEDYITMKDYKCSTQPHPDVERMRSAHRNDLENIIPFLLIALIYISTTPNPVTAQWLFHIFTAARILYSIAYANALSYRLWHCITFLTGMAVNISMCVMCLCTFYKHAHYL